MSAKTSLYAGMLALSLVFGLVSACTRAPDDAQIAGEVQARIEADPNVATKQITVNSNNGVVTLSGTVASDAEREAAARDAARVEGVKTVVNNLQVAPAAAPVEEARAEEPPPAPARTPRRKPSPRTRVYEEQPAARSAAPADTGRSVQPTSPAAPAAVAPVSIPAGTTVSIRMIDEVDTSKNQPGDTFRASLDSPIYVNDKIVVPEDADVEGQVVELKTAGRFKGRSELALELTRLIVNGKTYQITTSQFTKQGSSRGKRTAATVGGGAALGAIIGGIAGGGKGAAIGAAVGAGAGTGVQAATKGEQIVVKPEAVLHFELSAPVAVTPATSITRDAQRRRIE